MDLRADADKLIRESIYAVLPENAVKKALQNTAFGNKIVVVAIGKAAWKMAKAAGEILNDKIYKGIVVTKYHHSEGDINGFEIFEAAHPIPDKNSILGTSRVLEVVADMPDGAEVVFLVSGGGSSLFEKPLDGVFLEDIVGITNQLLSSGANIVEMNTVRKHLSAVKGGRFAKQCGNAKIHTIVLSDVLGDRLDSIASGPAYPDNTTSEEAFEILSKYNINVGDNIKEALRIETPKSIENSKASVIGSVTELCKVVAENAKKMGYNPLVLSTTLNCEAREAGSFMASVAREIKSNMSLTSKPPCAVIIGGETVVHIRGKGKGGRNQELALSAAIGITGLDDVLIFSLGSDGTDGPTDAAGGLVDGKTVERLNEKSIRAIDYLDDNNSYNALKVCDGLIMTGPTGTNVNDVIVLLAK